MATLGGTRIKDLVTNPDQMLKTVYDSDNNGKIDHNELENMGVRTWVSTDNPLDPYYPHDPDINDVWFKIT